MRRRPWFSLLILTKEKFANEACRNLAAVMFAPGAAALCAEFGITDTVVASLTVSIYILGFALGPLIIASLSEIYGRLVIYHTCNVVYIGFTIGCALSTNTAMFLVFRFLCGCAASSPMAIGGGTIADLYVAEERGKAMALFGLGPLLGPVCLAWHLLLFTLAFGTNARYEVYRSCHWRVCDPGS